MQPDNNIQEDFENMSNELPPSVPLQVKTEKKQFLNDNDMFVTKRNGKIEAVSFDKILKRIKRIGQNENIKINYTNLAIKVIDQLYNKISTMQIDELSAEQCASMVSIHPDYYILASRIIILNHHKNTPFTFSKAMTMLYKFKDNKGKQHPLLAEDVYDIINKNAATFDALCGDCSRDFLIDYFGFKTLERSYLMKINQKIVERPQYMWLRVSIGIHKNDIERVIETYNLMSQKYFTHATPTLFNSGTPHPQNSSCYLTAMESDSIEGIYNTLKDCALISKWAGGIGLHIHNIRAQGSQIRGTNGISNGIVPMLKVFNNTAKYVDQGGGRRNGSIAVYVEPWHADIELFLEMRKNHGDEEMKARDLFYALWIPDLFMERVKTDGEWTLMCPDECPGLADVYGEAFNKLYKKYESELKGKKTISARNLWFQILDAQMETGTPYILYKDSANNKSNQQNIGTIKSSNLCVAPETLVLTENGHIEIQKLEGQTVNIWNGYEYSSVTVFKTGKDQELINIETDDGCVLTCTKYHKFFIQSEEEITTTEAQHLKTGDVLMQCNFPIIDKNSFEEDYIPSQNAMKEKMSWLTDYCERSNIIFENNTIVCTSIHILLIKIKLMLQTCGINPIIQRYDNNFNICKLFISKKEIQQLILLGFNPKNIDLTEIKREMMTTSSPTDTIINYDDSIELFDHDLVRSKHIPNYVTIKNIINRGRIDDTFCFNEPKRNSAIFNGILTSQCTEIIQYSNDKETAVCNLASIALPAFIETNEDGVVVFNHEKLHNIVRVVTYNLNKIIDINFYPIEKTKTSNMRHRPIGIGVQGLADVFMMMNLPFTSDTSKILNQEIFETIYHAALEESCNLSKMFGSYETFIGSPASIGKLQFDLWNKLPGTRYNWNEMKENIKIHGLRNSLLLAPMPTASTSQILGYNECFEPITSNIYSRRTLAGEFIVANKYLMKDMIKLGLWNEKVKNNIIANNGSIQNIDVIPIEIREKYKTVWEIPMRDLIDMSADRGIYICQSQSLNLWLEDPNYNTLTSMHFYSWSKGLKTGIYYLRRRARHQAQQFTVEPDKPIINEHDICEMCSS
jgi:ribonucleotide reductase alpha subunit